MGYKLTYVNDINPFMFTKMFFEHDFWFTGKQGFDPYKADHTARRRKDLMAYRAERIRKQIAHWEEKVENANPRFSQTKKLIAKFGGVVPFSVAIGITPDRVISYYLGITKKGVPTKRKGGRWRTGMLPHRILARCIVVARYWGVYLTPEDIWPDYVQDPRHVKNLAANKEMMEWIKNRNQKISYTQFEDMVALLVSTQD